MERYYVIIHNRCVDEIYKVFETQELALAFIERQFQGCQDEWICRPDQFPIENVRPYYKLIEGKEIELIGNLVVSRKIDKE